MAETTVRERPVIFSGLMINAILDGRKTQTRRVAKLRDTSGTYSCFGGGGWPESADEYGDWHRDSCPFGSPGDRLWLRETFCLRSDLPISRIQQPFYAADPDNKKPSGWPWTSPRFMPRWASRITLRVEEVRVERVQEITEADARAEGCDGRCPVGSIPAYDSGPCSYHFAQVWDALNGPRGFGWQTNPWVWVVTFSREDPMSDASAPDPHLTGQ